MEINSPVELCEVKIGLQPLHHNIENQVAFTNASSVQQNDGRLQTIHLAKGAKEVDILKAAAAVTSGASSVILEGIDTSVLFPHGVNRDGSITVEWDGNKCGSFRSDKNSSENSVLFSQAQTLIDLFHELFKTSSTPLQIILEPQEPGELVYFEQKINNDVSNINLKDIRDSNEESDYKDTLKEAEMENVKEPDPKPTSLINNCKNHETHTALQLIHRCYYCSFGSEIISVVMEHVRNQHPDKSVRTKTISGRNCPYCCMVLDQTAFFMHMRKFHRDAHPFRCGYCSFMGRDLNQVKHHYSKKHQEKPFKCFRRSKSLRTKPQSIQNLSTELHNEKSAGDNKDEGNLVQKKEVMEMCELKSTDRDVSENEEEESFEEVCSSEDKYHYCPVCHKKIKKLKYLKVHMRSHGQGRYKCGYCSYVSVYLLQALRHCKKRHRLLQPKVKHHELDPSQNKSIVKNIDNFMKEITKKCLRQPPDPDTRKWARKYSCPHCEYTCSFGASYRRHLTTHTTSPYPFQCKYCSYESREKYYVRRHIQRVHRGHPVVVLENDIQASPKKVIEQASNNVDTNDTTTRSKPISKKSLSTKNVYSLAGKKKSKVTEILEPDNTKETLGVFSEIGLKEKNQKANMNGITETKENAIKVLDKDIIYSSGDILQNESGLDSILNENRNHDLRVIEDEDKKTNSIFDEKQMKINAEKRITKKSAPKREPPKDITIQKTLSVDKGPIGLSKGTNSNNPAIELNLIPTSDENASFEGIASEIISTENATICTSLNNLLQEGVNRKKNDNVSSSEKNIENVSVDMDTNSIDDDQKAACSSKVKAGKAKTNCRKKGTKEKSTHRAWDFVAFKDGKHTYCVCGTRTVNKAFYKHIKKHMNSKPFGCGYCPYRSIERAKVRVHHTFVHPGLPVIVNENEENADKDLQKDNVLENRQNIETATNAGASKNVHKSASKKNSRTNTQVSVDFQCPICYKKISYHSSTIRQHFYSHYDYRPYQCGRCDFRGCSPGGVKQHSVFHGADLCPIVIPSGQEPPEGLEQLMADCFKEIRTKFGIKTRNSQKGNAAKISNCSLRGDLHSKYNLVTKEAISWHETLSNGVCPWCRKVVSSLADIKKIQDMSEIKNHFKSHFKSIEDTSINSSDLIEESSMPFDLPSSIEEKDGIIMNGLMYYFIHHPMVSESDNKEISELESTVESGEMGIINCPDGMPQGTIQITDSLLADLRHLLWGQEFGACSRKFTKHLCRKCNLNFESAAALQLHSECHESSDGHHSATKETHTNSQFALWDVVTDTQTDSQVPDTEVGVLLLGEDIEMTTAVVVVNPEAGIQKEMEITI